MKSLERRFSKITKRNPHWSSYMCFAEAIKSQKFNSQTIHRWFYKLVDKDDYCDKDKKELFAQLEELSNALEDNKK